MGNSWIRVDVNLAIYRMLYNIWMSVTQIIHPYNHICLISTIFEEVIFLSMWHGNKHLRPAKFDDHIDCISTKTREFAFNPNQHTSPLHLVNRRMLISPYAQWNIHALLLRWFCCVYIINYVWFVSYIYPHTIEVNLKHNGKLDLSPIETTCCKVRSACTFHGVVYTKITKSLHAFGYTHISCRHWFDKWLWIITSKDAFVWSPSLGSR